VIFSPRFSIFEAQVQKSSTLWKVKIAMDTLAQNLEREKSKSNILMIVFFMLIKLDFKRIFQIYTLLKTATCSGFIDANQTRLQTLVSTIL